MGNEWKKTNIYDIVEIISGGTPKTDIPEYWDGSIPWLSVSDYNTGFRWVDSSSKTITEKGLKESATNLLQERDIIISARGTVGVVAQLKRPMAFNQSSYGIRGKKGIADTDFIYYALKFLLAEILKVSYGGVFSTITINSFKSLEIKLPPLDEQKIIAYILGSLDDKIELNRNMSTTLEGIAQALFKSWFVDFDPVHAKIAGSTPIGLSPEIADLFPDSFVDSEIGKIPKGWEVASLDNIATFLNGLALQKSPPNNQGFLPVIKIAQMRVNNTNNADKAGTYIDDKYIVEDGDILFSWSGTLECMIWTGGRGALNQHLFKVSSDKYPKWFIYFWTQYHLPEFRHIAESRATTMGHIQRHHLTDAKVLIPPQELLDKIDDHISHYITKLVVVLKENKLLSDIRDVILPYVMAGE